ncbi:MAG: acetyl-CoA C-acetyltransferase [Armatimonadetes bacterium]|nr:acetyl-CoA C-acetyltransferase [Armatimonadota bacterium]
MLAVETVSKYGEPQLDPRVKARRRRPDRPDPVIVAAARTPIGKFMGAFLNVPAPELAAHAIRAAVHRAGIAPEEVDEVIMGNVISAGLGQNPTRQALLKAGLPHHVGALTINKVCASGLKALVLACQGILTGDIDCAVVGGMENMSRTPYLMTEARTGYRLGHGKLIDSMVHDGLWCAHHDFHMGESGELVAERYGLSREAQDQYALESHKKAVAAQQAGKFDREIVPVPVPGKKKGETILIDRDESPRADSSLEALGKLSPAFKKGGTVTAGNAPGVNDGAAALVVMSAERAAELGLKPLARIRDWFTAGLDPAWVMLTPIPAVRGLLKRNEELSLDKFDAFEVNEAFSVQSMAVLQELGLDPGKVNVNGGAVALGHPIGASGARIMVSLLHALQDRGGKQGIATLCLGGGNGVAVAVEML